MGHPKYKNKVSKMYKTMHPSGAGSESIKARNNIAIKLLAQEPEEVKIALREEASEQLRLAKERYEDQKRGLPSNEPEDIAE